MDVNEYRRRGKEMVDYIADYLENIRDRRVFPDVKPGYMRPLLPEFAPIEGENWDAIFADVERVIMPGITHWQSPHMHAYFPALNSFPSLLGDMLADAINCLGFTWASSPACTELEVIVMNWLGKMIGLPDDFLHLHNKSPGGGVIQTTASEATLVCLLAGRTRAIQRFHEHHPGFQDAEINARLVAYCSDQAHSSVEKAALIGLVRMRFIEADDSLAMRGKALREAIEDDIKQGLVPFWVCATLGTTGSCSFDNLEEIGIVCRDFNIWLHVDSAYAGSAFICPEFRTWLRGIERADSIAFNPSKWLMVHFDATALWIKDSTAVHRTFNVEPLYLQHENSGVSIDYMHWQIPLSRRFRALKVFFVLRSYGIKGLQKHIREGVRLAQKFEALVLADHRFEIPAKRHLGMVVFRIKGENEITERLLKRLNHRGNLHCIPSSLKGKYVIRFTVTSTNTTADDIVKDWNEIRRVASMILDEMNITISNRNKVYLKDTKDKSEAFGSSLLLSNSPLSPKIVNGSFAAIFDADEFLAKTYAGVRIAHQESPSMRRRVRGILMSGKQFSLDSHMDVVVQNSFDSGTNNSSAEGNGTTTPGKKGKNPNSICEDSEESTEDYPTVKRTDTLPAYSTMKIAAEYLRRNPISTSMNFATPRYKSTATQTSQNHYQPLHATLNEASDETSEDLLSEKSVRDTANVQLVAASCKLLLANSLPTLGATSSTAPASLRTTPSPPLPAPQQQRTGNNNFTQQMQAISNAASASTRAIMRANTMQEVYHGKRYLDTGLAVGPTNNYFSNTIINASTPSGGATPTTPSAETPDAESQWSALFHSFDTAPAPTTRGVSYLSARLLNMDSLARSTSTLPSIDESASECMSISSASTHADTFSMPAESLSKRHNVTRFYSAPSARQLTATMTSTLASFSLHAATLSEDETDADAWQVARCDSSEDYSIASSDAHSRSSSLDLV
ncbi:histidine decarboxylase isoform X1 [Zeugodacus cucurbitae]|uniref:histidine decarboxylase isoform X1 n=1 Tax=Zeugodacus cucurbitae TaxID=28588 RepID=UPI0023D8F388|nr:histidine decarboxylase isoform X1 [Zeugodacus cucurbitae]XP_054089228.1 histidine decarboxylase isoform X1 [Zeugodacus cucurbitae]XP_054089229.1 histidine decarboxylase isoform X1 [Zeugodacus cucurbitae]XP_054089230.1 histidine decarboxylase isoform X1 [Zeugodacus cucurbitae]XP_054089231.1 histidine decarboxylase isoform X1 [Zeugodacus cucurbitae]